MKRYLSILGLATLGTFFLFALMNALISTRGSDTRASAPTTTIDFIRHARDETTQTKQRKPPRPPPLNNDKPPPPPPANFTPPAPRADKVAPTLGAFDFRGLFAGAPVDGDALALVRVLPHYPSRALQRGIEGWVLLEFSINTLGQPQSPRVVESQPKGVFDASAIAAVKRWKYRPMVQDGQAQNRTLIRQRIRFQLAGR